MGCSSILKDVEGKPWAVQAYTYPVFGNPADRQTLFAPEQRTVTDANNSVATETLSFGINGSLRRREVQSDHTTFTEYYLFNSAANLKAYSNNGLDFAYYGYNAANTRTYKLSFLNMNQWVNGQPEPIQLQMQQAMFYPNAYLNFNQNGEYTKHYYNGSERIASRLGDMTAYIYAEAGERLENRIMRLDALFRSQIGELVSYEEPEQPAIPADRSGGTRELVSPPVEYEPFLSVSSLQQTGSPDDIFYYHMNHLGSTAYVTDQSQNVTQGFLYAPFGEITTEYNANFGSDIIPKYSFNAKELDEETGMYYYEARYYKPPVFTSRDAMMEQKPWLSPYHYCSNNPVGRVDPSGMLDDDYFNKDGNYLGSDDAQTDNVRIISQSDWDANKTVDVNGNATIDHAVGNEQSQMFSGASLEMTEAAQLAVYNHYNTTGLKIFSHKKNSSMTTYMSSDGTASIGINLKKNRGEGGVDICNRANEIINTFVHEKDHFERHRKNPQEYNNTPEWLREHWAIKAQLKDPSWEKVSYKYRKSVWLYDKECDSQVWCNIK